MALGAAGCGVDSPAAFTESTGADHSGESSGEAAAEGVIEACLAVNAVGAGTEFECAPAASCCVDDPSCCDSDLATGIFDRIEILEALRDHTMGGYAYGVVFYDSLRQVMLHRTTSFVIHSESDVEVAILERHPGGTTTSVAAGVTLRPPEFFDGCIASAQAEDSCRVVACFRELWEPASCNADMTCFDALMIHGTPCD